MQLNSIKYLVSRLSVFIFSTFFSVKIHAQSQALKSKMHLPAKPLLQIVQNPVINILELKYFSPLNQEIQLQIFDNTGNIVLSRQLNVLKGDNLLRVEESSCLNSGIYIVSVMDKTLNRYHVKLIKK